MIRSASGATHRTDERSANSKTITSIVHRNLRRHPAGRSVRFGSQNGAILNVVQPVKFAVRR